MGENEMMNLNEVSMLIDWLREHGHSEAEITDCIQYLAKKPSMDSNRNKKTP